MIKKEELIQECEKFGIVHDISERFERSIPNHPLADKIFKLSSEADLHLANDFLEWNDGGEGDNGEIFKLGLSIMLELEEARQIEKTDMLMMDGYDDCIAGVVEQCGLPDKVCYDLNKITNKMVIDGATYEEAKEYIAHNQVGAYMGEGTPCFLTPSMDMYLETLEE